MTQKTITSGMLLLTALLMTNFAFSDSNYYTWDDEKGFQAAQKCDVVEASDLPLFVVDSSSNSARTLHLTRGSTVIPNESIIRVSGPRDSKTRVQVIGLPNDAKLNSTRGTMSSSGIKDLIGRVLQIGSNPPVETFGSSNIPVAQTLWEVEMRDGSYLVSHCENDGHPLGYMLFNVFTPDSKTPVLEVGLLASDTKILEDSIGYTTEEAEKLPTGSTPAKSTPVVTAAKATAPAAAPQTATPTPLRDISVICTPHGAPASILDATLRKVVGHIDDDTAIDINSSSTKRSGRSTYLSVKLMTGNLSGWVDRSMVMPATVCGNRTPKGMPSASTALKLVPPAKPAPTKTVSTPPAKAPAAPAPTTKPAAPSAPTASIPTPVNMTLVDNAAPWHSKTSQSMAWTQTAVAAIEANMSDLNQAQDINTFCPKYTTADYTHQVICWVRIFGAIMQPESDYNPSSYFPENTGQPSVGLLSMSAWQCPKNANLKDAEQNITCGITYMAQLIASGKFGKYISGSGYQGAARNWSSLQPPHKVYVKAAGKDVSVGFKQQIIEASNTYLNFG